MRMRESASDGDVPDMPGSSERLTRASRATAGPRSRSEYGEYRCGSMTSLSGVPAGALAASTSLVALDRGHHRARCASQARTRAELQHRRTVAATPHVLRVRRNETRRVLRIGGNESLHRQSAVT